MGKKQTESENASSKDFVKERIKARPLNKAKLLRKTLSTVLSAVVFGFVFCLCFIFLEPRIDNLLHKDDEVPFVEFPEDAVEEEMLPENMLTDEQQEQGEIVPEVLDITDYQELQNSLANLADKVRRSIVSVTGISTENNWFENSYENKSFSSGVIVADNGQEYLILVKATTIEKAESIVVVFYNEKQAAATLIQVDGQSGYGVVAVNKDNLSEVDKENITVATLGSSNLSPILGSSVIAIGNPMGTGDGICYGNVTSVGKTLSLVDSNYKLMTTDIYGSTQGSGVLVNMNGHVIGIIDNSYNSLDLKNIVSAIGISEMKTLIENLSNDLPIPYMGVKGVSVTTSVNSSYGVPLGAYVTSVSMDSPAMLAGIQSGDVITEFDGKEIHTFADLTKAIFKCEKEKKVKVKVERETFDGYSDMTIRVTLK